MKGKTGDENREEKKDEIIKEGRETEGRVGDKRINL